MVEKIRNGLISVIKGENTAMMVKKVVTKRVKKGLVELRFNSNTEKILEEGEFAAAVKGNGSPAKVGEKLGVKSSEEKLSDSVVSVTRAAANEKSEILPGETKGDSSGRKEQNSSENCGGSFEEKQAPAGKEKQSWHDRVTKGIINSSALQVVGRVAGVTYSILTEGMSRVAQKFVSGDLGSDMSKTKREERMESRMHNLEIKMDTLLTKSGVDIAKIEGLIGIGKINNNGNGETSKNPNGGGNGGNGGNQKGMGLDSPTDFIG